MDHFKKKYIKYKTKYINLQNGRGYPNAKFNFMIDSSILPIEDISKHFDSKFHIKQGRSDYKEGSLELANKVIGITIRKEFPDEHLRLLDIIKKNNFIVEKNDLIVDNSYFNIDALQHAEIPITTFIIHKDKFSTKTYKRELLEQERDKQERKEQEERERKEQERERKEQERERKEQELVYLDNLYKEIVLLIGQIQHKSSTELPRQLQNIIQSIEKIKRLEDSTEKNKILFNIAKDHIQNSFFNESIEKVLSGIVPTLQLTRKIQELSRTIYDQFGLFFDSEVEMVTEDDEDIAFDTQLNMLFEDLIRPPISQKMSEALEEIMKRRNAHVYRVWNPYPGYTDPITGEDLLDLCPSERILIHNRCYAVKSLYKWIIIENNNKLPRIEKIITKEQRQKLIELYQRLNDWKKIEEFKND